ncbi:DUF4350 domain-containing protein [Cellulomonas sp. GbtcB1]|uniref:DUF4350 domain-containing protein n=1 Tax=Cellulomonas sp. GbtcB1 TaxID=2824746 RepID=UPI0020C65F29|nr:DUF4350 domain-containing protein [Cellulomonas sp. GbtcB1]
MTAPATTRAPGAPAGPDRADGVVLGDGTTARTRAGARWRRVRWLVVVAVVLGIGVLAALLPAPTRSATALAPDNPRENGAMALAEVLRDQGVGITYVRSAGAAVAAADAGRTLLVTSDWLLSGDQITALAGTAADLVLLDPSYLVDRTVPGLTTGWSGGAQPSPVAASCDDPDAAAAGTISATGAGVTPLGEAAPAGTTLCFPVPGSSPQAFLYATSEADGRRVTVLGDAGLITNARVADEGNAALALRALGRNAELVWYVPSAGDLGADEAGSSPGLGDLLPPVARVLLLQALVVVLVIALWRGRRLGRVVAERLPVVVRPAETTRGRARLYRTSRSYGHAAASLRAGTAARLARRLGVPRSAAAPDVVTAVARAARRDEADVRDLLYGPPPTSDAGLEHLARRLDQLESEVHPT